MFRRRKTRVRLIAMLEGVRQRDGVPIAVVCAACGDIVDGDAEFFYRVAIFSPDDAIVVWRSDSDADARSEGVV